MPKAGDTGTVDGQSFVWKKSPRSNVLTRDFTKKGQAAAKKKAASTVKKTASGGTTSGGKKSTGSGGTASGGKKNTSSGGTASGDSKVTSSSRPRLRPDGLGTLTSSSRPRLRPTDTTKTATNGVRPTGGTTGLQGARKKATNTVRPTGGNTGLQGARKKAKATNMVRPTGGKTGLQGALPSDVMKVDPAKFLPERLVKAAKRSVGSNPSMKDLYAILSKKLTNEDIMKAYRRFAKKRKDSISAARS